YCIACLVVDIKWVCVGIVGSIFIGCVNYRGIKFSSAITLILTLLIIIAGILLITGSFISGNVQNMQPFFENGLSGFLTVVIMSPFMFVGFDIIPQAAEEINLPPRNIGKLLIFS